MKFSIRQLHKDDLIGMVVMAMLLLPVLYLSLFLDFERESGDNIVHYYFARYSPLDPIRFLDLWAKPVFTLLASPFAQFGFAGMKLFNALAGWFSAVLVFKSAQKLKLPFPWLAPVFLFFAPTYFTLLFSGYTEPLFGLFLILMFYLVLQEKYIAAALLASFMPFVRTEGVMFIAILAAFLLWQKSWKALPFLLTGSIVFSLIGWFSGKDLLWIITSVPYKVHSNYGSGTLTHYAEQWLLTVGVPLTISSVAGIFIMSYRLLSPGSGKDVLLPREKTLLLVMFLANFMFHTLTWYLGLFTAFGLIRLMVPLVPLQALFSIYAFSLLARQKAMVYRVLAFAFVGFVLVFPFLNNPASFNFKKDFTQKPELLVMKEISHEIKEKYQGYRLYYSEPYLSYALGINHFDLSLHNDFTEMTLDQIQAPALIIWDSWTSVHFGVNVHDFGKAPGYRLIKTYFDPDNPQVARFKMYLKE